ncbi:MAG: hypothetical protein HYZ72_15685 [Deltaproteobacteria bacterium]|nr:hypothetical protein [Deltaproteobacteria bacterium]
MSGNIEAEPLKTSSSGTFISTEINTGGDPLKAVYLNFKGKGTVLGPFSAQAFNESQVILSPPPPNCTLPNGTPGIQLGIVQGKFVFRKESTGDLLLSEVSSQANCLSVACGVPPQAGCIFSINQQHTITGGTDQFAEASGSFQVTGIGEFLVGGPAGSFGFFTTESEGEINIPH